MEHQYNIVDCLVELGGASVIGTLSLFSKDPNPRKFFAPFSDTKSNALRVASVFVGPLASTLTAILAMVQGVGIFLSKPDWHKPPISCGAAFLAASLLLLTALISPLINLIDLIGGGINTIGKKLNETSYAPSY